MRSKKVVNPLVLPNKTQEKIGKILGPKGMRKPKSLKKNQVLPHPAIRITEVESKI